MIAFYIYRKASSVLCGMILNTVKGRIATVHLYSRDLSKGCCANRTNRAVEMSSFSTASFSEPHYSRNMLSLQLLFSGMLRDVMIPGPPIRCGCEMYASQIVLGLLLAVHKCLVDQSGGRVGMSSVQCYLFIPGAASLHLLHPVREMSF